MNYPGWLVLLCLIILTGGCEPADRAPATAVAAGTPALAHWACRNDVEVSCNTDGCEVQEAFTPMEVRVDEGGSMSVCAYSGCWEGTGTVTRSDAFIVFTGEDIPFSTAPDAADSRADIVVALDRADNVAVLKAEGFAHPLRCEQTGALP